VGALRGVVRFMAAALLAAAFLPASADCGKDPECDNPGPWSKFTAATFTSSQAGSPGSLKFKGTFDHASGDFLLDIDADMPSGPMKGLAGMIEGRIMVSKGLALDRGREIDAIDGPFLSLRLATIVLGRVFPKGPESLPPKVKIAYTGDTGIKFATPSAGGYIPPHWKVDGEVRKGDGGLVEYDMVLTLRTDPKDASKTMSINMSGLLSQRSAPVFDDRMSLDGWIVYGVGPQVEKQAGKTILDYGAKPKADPALKTVADVRRIIAEEKHPGERDPSRDFTGFWKSDCKDAFGLQIKRGSDGMYSIVFCGPGGCGDSERARRTFITGDRHFEVVSESELIEIDRSGNRERMLRCTKETNPILKY
jgi:hypothetical protein